MRQLNVLVVDDEPGIRELISDALSRHGCAVSCAENGVEAVARVAEYHSDIVFLDIRMPKGDGITALREIHKLWPELPVILITGGTDPETLKNVFEMGASACLIKPFSLADIAHMLDAYGPQLADAA